MNNRHMFSCGFNITSITFQDASCKFNNVIIVSMYPGDLTSATISAIFTRSAKYLSRYSIP